MRISENNFMEVLRPGFTISSTLSGALAWLYTSWDSIEVGGRASNAIRRESLDAFTCAPSYQMSGLCGTVIPIGRYKPFEPFPYTCPNCLRRYKLSAIYANLFWMARFGAIFWLLFYPWPSRDPSSCRWHRNVVPIWVDTHMDFRSSNDATLIVCTPTKSSGSKLSI